MSVLCHAEVDGDRLDHQAIIDESLLILPKKGNVHRLQAIDDCVFLDLLAPPYAEPEGRPCHHYREEKEFSLHGETLMRLVRE